MGGTAAPCFAPLVSCCYGAFFGHLRHVSRGMLFSCWYHLQPCDTHRAFPGIFYQMTNHYILCSPPQKPPTNHKILCSALVVGVFPSLYWLAYCLISNVSSISCRISCHISFSIYSIFTIILDRTICNATIVYRTGNGCQSNGFN